MSTLKAEPIEAPRMPAVHYWNAKKGIKSWIFTLDHKRIGMMYLISILIAFSLGGLFAMLVRTELLTPGKTIMSANQYNQAFTMHGAVMVFLFIIPSIPAALGNFFLPMQLGAKDVAFPRLNLASYWIYVVGASFALYSLLANAVDTGWTFYTPYSLRTSTAVLSMVTAVFILGFSSIFTGLNFVVTVHKLRPPGMSFFRMPLFVWSIYATSIIQILATPVLAITTLLLIMERTMNVGIFDPRMGGDPVLFQHFFWFYSHPAVYIMIVPAFGIVSELIAAFTHRPIFGYRFVALSSVAIAIIGFLVWGHHLFVSGMSEYAAMVFSFLTFFVAVPTAVKMFNWTATLYRGQIWLATPMLYALEFLFNFLIGGLTGLFLGALATDIHLTDTYFVVAHFHYVMMGGTVFAFMGGLHYWWPKMTGRMYNEKVGKVASVLMFIGFNGAFFPQFILGLHGMPRRYYNYIPEFQPLHAFSSVFAYLIGLSFVIAGVNLAVSLKRGAIAGKNPWGASTLEWITASPPPTENFEETPKVTTGPYVFPPDETLPRSAA